MITLLICLLLLLAVPASAGEISETSENLCIANVESYVNVRKAPSAESDLVGKMYRYGVGKVISEKETDEGTWYRIRSGHVTGYISSEFLVTGEEAKSLLPEATYSVARVIPAELNVYDEPASDSNMLAVVNESAFLNVLDEADGWTQIVTPYQITGWVPTDQLTFSEVCSYAETTAQEEERLRQQADADAAAEAEKEQWLLAEEALGESGLTHSAVTDAVMAQEEARKVFLESGGTRKEADAIEHEILDVTGEETSSPEPETTDEPLEETSSPEPETADEPLEETSSPEPETSDEPLEETSSPEPEYARTYRSAVEEVLEARQAMEAEQERTDAIIAKAQRASVKASAAERVAIEAARNAPRGAEGCEYTTQRDHTIYYLPSLGEELVSYAAQFVGNPYVWGGESLTNGCDCSGFTMLVYARYGIELPHFAMSQATFGTPVEEEDLQPGDLVFFERGDYIYHVAIYIGNGTIIHAASSSSGICFSNLHYSTANLLFRRLLKQ